MIHLKNKTRIFAASLMGFMGTFGAVQSATALSAFMEAQSATLSEPSSQLTLSITGLSEQSGEVLVAVFDTQEGYATETPFRDKTVPVSSNALNIQFQGLPVGEYAFKLFHDVDGDGELGLDLLGIPSEPYYFSNDASDPFSAPEWDEAKFLIPVGQVTKTIELE